MKFWEDPSIFQQGTVKPHASLRPHTCIKDAVEDDMYSACRSVLKKSLNGEWDFAYYRHASEVPDDFACVQVPDEGPVKYTCKIKVPMSWQLDLHKGYDLPQYVGNSYLFQLDPPHVGDGPVGIYRKTFTLDRVYGKKGHIILCFAGGGSCLDVWVNGRQAGIGKGSHLPSEFDITDYIADGENTLVVRVFKFSDGSYLECQDHFFLSGLFREVYLLERQDIYVRDVYARAHYCSGKIDVSIELSGRPDADGVGGTKGPDVAGEAAEIGAAEAEVYLYDKEKLITKIVAAADSRSIDLCIDAAGSCTDALKPWNAEEPYTYKLIVHYGSEWIPVTIGFRDIEIEDGVFKLNGVPVKLKGVNRHDMNPWTGYYVTAEEMKREIFLMKQAGINAVRTSHYPNAPEFYELCSRYGIYVLDETDLETHGTMYGSNATVLTDDSAWEAAYIDRMQRMVERDKNHPCVLIWSLGNESYMGRNHTAMAKWSHARDTERPVHYEPFDTKELDAENEPIDEVDIIAKMYPSPEELKEVKQYRRKKRPVFMCEYGHALGLGPGSMDKYWDVIYSDDRFLGGCEWEWRDLSVEEIFPNGKKGFITGSYYKLIPDDMQMNSDGLLFPDLRPKSSYFELKHAIQPVRFYADPEAKQLTVFNTQDFRGLDHFSIHISVMKNGIRQEEKVLDHTVCLPMQTVKTDISDILRSCSLEDAEYALLFEAKLAYDTDWAEAGFVCAVDQLVLPVSGAQNNTPVPDAGSITVEKGKNEFIIAGKGFRYVFNTSVGQFTSIVKDGCEYLKECPRFVIWRAPIDNDVFTTRETEPVKRWKKQDMDHSRTVIHDCTIAGNVITVEAAIGGQRSEPVIRIVEKWTVSSEGMICFESESKVRDDLKDIPRFGWEFYLDESFDRLSYYGYGPGQSYPDMHGGSYLAVWESDVASQRMPYLKPQENGAHIGTRWARLQAGEKSVKIISDLPRGFMFKSSYNTAEEEETAGSYTELEHHGSTVVNIDYSQTGVGSAACGPTLPDADLFSEKNIDFRFRIEFD